MNAIEFQTTITDSFVQIPNYKEFKNKQVKIIVIDNSIHAPIKNNTNQKSIDTLFDQFSIDMQSFLFDRNEANER